MVRFPTSERGVFKEVVGGEASYYCAAHTPNAKMQAGPPYSLPTPKGKELKRKGPAPREVIQFTCPECNNSILHEQLSPKRW